MAVIHSRLLTEEVGELGLQILHLFAHHEPKPSGPTAMAACLFAYYVALTGGPPESWEDFQLFLTDVSKSIAFKMDPHAERERGSYHG